MKQHLPISSKTLKMKLPAILMIALISLIGLAASSALLFDSEVGQESTFQAGTLDLTLSNLENQQLDAIEIDQIGTVEQEAGVKSWNVRNVGTLPGILEVSIVNIQNLENGCTAPEQLLDTTCNDPGLEEGELGSFMQMDLQLYQSNEPLTVVSTSLETPSLQAVEQMWKSQLPDLQLDADQTVRIDLEWSMGPEGYDNTIQSDSISFDVVFTLRQIVN